MERPPLAAQLPKADGELLRSLVSEVERLRPLALEVENLWEHLRLVGLLEEPSSAPAEPPADSGLKNWVAQELADAREELRGELRGSWEELRAEQAQLRLLLARGQEAIGALELEAGRLREALTPRELQFGPPVGKTLNTQELMAMHAQMTADIKECRREIRQLGLGAGQAAVGAPAVGPPAAVTAVATPWRDGSPLSAHNNRMVESNPQRRLSATLRSMQSRAVIADLLEDLKLDSARKASSSSGSCIPDEFDAMDTARKEPALVRCLAFVPSGIR